MGFTQRPPTAGGLDPNTSPNLPIGDSSQAHDIPTGTGPSLAKIQDWIAWLRANVLVISPGGDATIPDDLTVTGDLTVGASASVGTDLTVGDDLIVTDDATIGGDASVTGTLTATTASIGTLNVTTVANVTGTVNVTGDVDASGFVDAAAYVTVSGTQPTSSADPGANRLYATNMVKAWGAVHFDGGVVTVLDGFSVASAAISLGTVGVITMAHAMANANYAVTISVGGADHARKYATVQATGKTTTVFQFNVWDELAEAAVDLSDAGTDLVVSFCVMGRQ